MNTRKFLVDVAITVPITFITAAAITYLYSLIFKGRGYVDWETAFQLAIIFGIVLPLTKALDNRSA